MTTPKELIIDALWDERRRCNLETPKGRERNEQLEAAIAWLVAQQKAEPVAQIARESLAILAGGGDAVAFSPKWKEATGLVPVYTAPPVEHKSEPVALNIDDAECVLHESLAAAHKRGPVSDDKVLLDELAKRGVFLARCAAPLDAEGIRLLREALDWVGLDSPMFEKIDAYLAKYSMDQP